MFSVIAPGPGPWPMAGPWLGPYPGPGPMAWPMAGPMARPIAHGLAHALAQGPAHGRLLAWAQARVRALGFVRSWFPRATSKGFLLSMSSAWAELRVSAGCGRSAVAQKTYENPERFDVFGPGP